MCGAFLSRSLGLAHRAKGGTVNPNQMMIAKAMVAQTALREEAAESRRRRNSPGPARATRKDHHFLGLLRRR